MKLLEMEKDMKIKHSVSSLFFLKKLFENLGTEAEGGCFTWSLIIKSCKGGGKVLKMHFKSKPIYSIMEGFILEVNVWEVSKVKSSTVSLLLTLIRGIDIFLKINTTNRGLNLKNRVSTLYLWG